MYLTLFTVLPGVVSCGPLPPRLVSATVPELGPRVFPVLNVSVVLLDLFLNLFFFFFRLIELLSIWPKLLYHLRIHSYRSTSTVTSWFEDIPPVPLGYPFGCIYIICVLLSVCSLVPDLCHYVGTVFPSFVCHFLCSLSPLWVLLSLQKCTFFITS